MQHVTRRSILSLTATFLLGACGHSVETTSVTTMPGHYTLQSQRGAEAVTTPGFVSRYQRQAIVTGTAPVPTSDCGKNFAGIMDHLETLMAPQIEENNRIAALQASNPRYQF